MVKLHIAYLILKKVIQPCKLLLSCGELEPKLPKINQFLVGEISKLLIPLNVETPCTKIEGNAKMFLIGVYLGAVHKGYPTFQLVSRFAKMGYEDI